MDEKIASLFIKPVDSGADTFGWVSSGFGLNSWKISQIGRAIHMHPRWLAIGYPY